MNSTNDTTPSGASAWGASYLRFGRLLVGWVLAIPALACAHSASAQLPSRSIPSDAHYQSFAPFMNGEYRTAEKLFNATPRVRSTGRVWIDSIPYHAMAGECRYQMGDLAGALRHFEDALQVYLRYPDFLLTLQCPASLKASSRSIRKRPTWGTSSRVIRLANIPDRIGSRQGNTDDQNLRAIQQGGVISLAQTAMVNAKEIVRCTALALRRRNEILGPVCEYDPLTNQLISTLSRRPALPNNWSQQWVSVLLGLAYAGNGSTADAVTELKRSLLIAGMDHNLTSTAMLELGKLAFRAQDFNTAEGFFREATFSAAVMANEESIQYHVLAEAFRWAMLTHLASGKGGVYPPLTPAAAWCRNGPRILESSVLLSLAENQAAVYNTKKAGPLLDRVRVLLRRRDFEQGVMGARHQFVSAQTYTQMGDSKAAVSLRNALKLFQNSASKRLFQIGLVDKLALSTRITTRQSVLLYENVLRDPTPLDWAIDPLETLAVLKTPHEVPYEHWMQLALGRKETDNALRISEMLRRHRFYSTLPLGGRLLNLRWTLAAPTESLTKDARLQRQDLLNRYPAFTQLADQVEQLRTEISKLPPVPEEQEQQSKLRELQNRLAEVAASQERILEMIALSREPSEVVFPPKTDVTVVQQQLAPNQRVLVFSSVQNSTFAFLLGTANYSPWKLEAPARVKANTAKMLRAIGQYDRNQAIGVTELTGTAWKDSAVQILKDLTANASADAWDEIEELIIVPDGILWYLPFEALQIEDGTERVSLIDKLRIRYVPTISLAVPDNRPRRRMPRSAIVTGSVFPRSDQTAAKDLFSQLQADDDQVYEIPIKTVLPTGLLPKTIDRLVVLNDLDNDPKRPYDWAPMAVDRGKASGSLSQWMTMPWGAPDQVVLPGFHTPAENALKKSGNGSDLFLTTCAMMASGSRTVLLSRWRDGGRTSHELVREFVRELPHRSAAEAWQRSIHLAVNAELDLEQEPRVKLPKTEASLKADHPFFWSGYMLIDTGTEPK